MTDANIVTPKKLRHETDTLRRVGLNELPESRSQAKNPPIETWLSKHFLVQVFDERGDIRITVNRTSWDLDRSRWVDGITWDELMACKRGIGRADEWAVELYPPDDAVVDVANLRHLWLVPEPSFGWNRSTGR